MPMLRTMNQYPTCLIARGTPISPISESTPLFGFRESGYRLPIALALGAEGLAVLCLGAFAAAQASR